MNESLPFMTVDVEAWHSSDKTWMVERKSEWAYVQHNLKVLGRPFIDERSIIGTHKKLFFNGVYDPRSSDQGDGSSVFGNKLPLFLMWYHPALSSDICRDVVEQCVKSTPATRALRSSLEALWQFGSQTQFRKEYGFMGGKEKIIVPVMLEDRTLEVIDTLGFSKISISSITSNVYNGINATLRSLNYPYHPGIYMWKYFLTRVHELDSEYEIELLKTAARMVFYFDQDPDTCKDDPGALALKNRLLDEFESGDFPAPLEKIWDEARTEGPRTH